MSFIDISSQTITSFNQIVDLIYLIFHGCLTLLLFFGFFELSFVHTFFPVLESWVGLGVMLVYLAVASLSKAQCTTQWKDNVGVLGVCYTMMGIGVLFIILGCCGGKRMRNRQLKKEQIKEELEDQ